MSWPIESIGPDFRHWSMHDLLGNKLFCLPSAILPCTSSALSVQSSQFFWWAIFRVNSMKWKNIPPIFLLLTSLCFASWRTRKPQLFLCSGLILRMNLVSPLLVLYSPDFNISHSSERKCSLCTKSIQERWWLQITRKYFHFLTQ